MNFIIQQMKTHTIPCPHQPPTRGNATVSVVLPPWRHQQLLPPDKV